MTRRLSRARSDVGHFIARTGARCSYLLARAVAGEITYPAAGLGAAVDALDEEEFGELLGESNVGERVDDRHVAEAERMIDEQEWRRGCG